MRRSRGRNISWVCLKTLIMMIDRDFWACKDWILMIWGCKDWILMMMVMIIWWLVMMGMKISMVLIGFSSGESVWWSRSSH